MLAVDREPEPEPEPPLDEPEPEPEAMERIGDIASRVLPADPEQALESRKDSLVQQAAALQVVDAGSYEKAAELARTFAGMIKDAEAHFDPDIAKANALHKSLCAKKNTFLGPLQTALDALKSRASSWWRTEEQKREAERRRLEEADRQRRIAESLRLEDEARAAAAAGKSERAQELVEEARAVDDAPPPPPPPSTVPKVRGISQRENWTFEVVDKKAFVAAVAAGEISLEAIEPCDVYLRARAKADKNTLKWPGVRFFDKGSVAVRS